MARCRDFWTLVQYLDYQIIVYTNAKSSALYRRVFMDSRSPQCGPPSLPTHIKDWVITKHVLCSSDSSRLISKDTETSVCCLIVV